MRRKGDKETLLTPFFFRYNNALDALQKTSHLYVSSLRRTMLVLKSVSSLIPIDPETKKPVLDTGAVSIMYPVVKGATQGLQRGSGKIGVYFKQLIGKGEGGWGVKLGRELAEGPLRVLFLYLADVSRLEASLTFSSIIPVMIREEIAFVVSGVGSVKGGLKKRREEGGRKKGGSRLGHRKDV